MAIPMTEEKFKEVVEASGKYTYISGFNYNKIEVIHNRCGAKLFVSYSAIKTKTASDTCKICRAIHKNGGYKKALINDCKREAQKMYYVLYEDGFVVGKDLDDYIRYNIRADELMSIRYDEDEACELIKEEILKKYEKKMIGQCKICKDVKTKKSWKDYDYYKKRICLKCLKEMNKDE